MMKHYIIGRKSAHKADILVDDKSISARHAELSVGSNSQIMIRDLDSSNGTSIIREGKKMLVLNQNIQVHKSDIVIFGTKNFSVSDFINSYLKNVQAVQNANSSNERYMRCPMCGSITPHGHPCVECGYKGNN